MLSLRKCLRSWNSNIVAEQILEKCVKAKYPSRQLLIGSDAKYHLMLLRMIPVYIWEPFLDFMQPIPACMKKVKWFICEIAKKPSKYIYIDLMKISVPTCPTSSQLVAQEMLNFLKNISRIQHVSCLPARLIDLIYLCIFLYTLSFHDSRTTLDTSVF
jgi:hypothetical protein